MTKAIGEIEGAADTFAQNLGEILTVMADRYPDPDDETAMQFVTSTTSGGAGVYSCSPRQYAEAVLSGTDFGVSIIDFYRGISANLGDPTGQRVINDLRAHFREEETIS